MASIFDETKKLVDEIFRQPEPYRYFVEQFKEKERQYYNDSAGNNNVAAAKYFLLRQIVKEVIYAHNPGKRYDTLAETEFKQWCAPYLLKRELDAGRKMTTDLWIFSGNQAVKGVESINEAQMVANYLELMRMFHNVKLSSPEKGKTDEGAVTMPAALIKALQAHESAGQGLG